MVLLAVVGAVFAALGGAAPTGIGTVDVVYLATAGAALTLAGSRSRRPSWLVSGVLALWVTPTTTGRVVALVALLVALYAVRQGRRRVLGAMVGALLVFVLGDLGSGPFLGSTFVFAAIAATPMCVSGVRRVPAGWRRPIALGLSTWLASAALATLIFGIAALLSVGDVTDGTHAANRGFDLASDADQDGAAASFDAAFDHFDSARGKVSGFWTLPARLVPIVGQHARAVQVVTAEGVALTTTASDAARAVDPDTIRMVDGGVDLRLVEGLQPILERTERAVDRAIDRVTEAQSPWLASPVVARLEDLLAKLASVQPSAHTASVVVHALPELLGADAPVNWLVAITTPAEARGLGGLLGNWVLIEADGGRVEILRSGRNEDVNALLRARDVPLSGPDQYVERWGRFSPNEFFQDVTLSPDLPMVAEVTADLFEQATDTRVDGVVFLDPTAIGAILRLVGPVRTDDIMLTADTVVPFLLEDQYIRYADDETARVVTLGQLITRAFAALTTGELPGPAALADVIGPVVEQDRLGIWWRDDSASELIDVAGLDGRFPLPDSDMVALVHQNAGQNKLDNYLRRELDYQLAITGDDARGTLAVTLHNDLADLTLPDSIIANNDQGYPVGTNVARLTIHTTLLVQSARLDGVEVVDAQRDVAFGHNAFTVVIEVPPGASRTLTLDVGGSLDPHSYSLSLPQQPLVNDDIVEVAVTADGVAMDIPERLTLSADTVLRP